MRCVHPTVYTGFIYITYIGSACHHSQAHSLVRGTKEEMANGSPTSVAFNLPGSPDIHTTLGHIITFPINKPKSWLCSPLSSAVELSRRSSHGLMVKIHELPAVGHRYRSQKAHWWWQEGRPTQHLLEHKQGLPINQEANSTTPHKD